MKRWMVAVLMCAAGAAQANSACDKPKDFDDLYCLNKVYQEADNELNSNYGTLVAQLDADGKKRLKAGQLRWIEQRNRNCSRRESDAFYVDLECATNTTIKRSQFLQDRLRECTSAGCQNSKL